jgi:hypothetical protein
MVFSISLSLIRHIVLNGTSLPAIHRRYKQEEAAAAAR